MGFFKELENEAKAREQKRAADELQRRTAEEAIRSEEAKKKEMHAQRERQANEFHKSSGITPLLSRFAGLVNGFNESDRPGIHIFVGDVARNNPRSESLIDRVRWDIHKDEVLGNVRFHREKFIVAETDFKGGVTFNRNLTISKEDWENNPQVLENALEKAYKNPNHRRFVYWYRPYRSGNPPFYGGPSTGMG